MADVIAGMTVSLELRVDVMPVLLGAGQRLFDDRVAMNLENRGVQQIGARTSLRFGVVR